MLLAAFVISPAVLPIAPAAAQVSRTPDPAPDDPYREAKLADRKKVAELNSAQANATARRDRANVQRRDAANARAQAEYRAAHNAWRRRVAACRGGDWSQCDR